MILSARFFTYRRHQLYSSLELPVVPCQLNQSSGPIQPLRQRSGGSSTFGVKCEGGKPSLWAWSRRALISCVLYAHTISVKWLANPKHVCSHLPRISWSLYEHVIHYQCWRISCSLCGDIGPRNRVDYGAQLKHVVSFHVWKNNSNKKNHRKRIPRNAQMTT